jgi:hypothetical protein
MAETGVGTGWPIFPCVLNGFWLAATCEDEFSGNATSYACMDVKVRLVNSMRTLTLHHIVATI